MSLFTIQEGFQSKTQVILSIVQNSLLFLCALAFLADSSYLCFACFTLAALCKLVFSLSYVVKSLGVTRYYAYLSFSFLFVIGSIIALLSNAYYLDAYIWIIILVSALINFFDLIRPSIILKIASAIVFIVGVICSYSMFADYGAGIILIAIVIAGLIDLAVSILSIIKPEAMQSDKMGTTKNVGKTLWKHRRLIVGAASVVSSMTGLDSSAGNASDMDVNVDGAGELDTDGDGIIDTIVNKSATGATEVLKDIDGDGFVDLVGYDFDGDGKFDAVN